MILSKFFVCFWLCLVTWSPLRFLFGRLRGRKRCFLGRRAAFPFEPFSPSFWSPSPAFSLPDLRWRKFRLKKRLRLPTEFPLRGPPSSPVVSPPSPDSSASCPCDRCPPRLRPKRLRRGLKRRFFYECKTNRKRNPLISNNFLRHF